MTLLTSASNAGGILPPEYADLIIKPLTELALPFQPQLATSFVSGQHELILPTLDSDVSAAWVNEGEEISTDDPEFGETKIVPSKVAGLTVVSREMVRDSSPDIQEHIGLSITRSIMAQVNKAFVGNLPAPAPKGLASLSGVVTMGSPGAFSERTLDTFSGAQTALRSRGRTISGWLLNPNDLHAYQIMKESSTSNRRLLDSVETIEGVPAFTHPDIPAGTAYGIDAAYTFTMLREDVELAISDQAFFTSDQVAVRATARVGFGFTDPQAIARLELYTPEP